MTGCNVTKLGLLRSCRVLASVFERNPGGGMVVGQAAVAYNCTFAANSCPVLASGYGKVYGCVMGGNGTADVYGSFEAMRYSLYALKNVTVDGSNVNETPIKFVSSETGDWRLLSTSAGTALSLLTYYSYNGYLPVTFDGVPFAATDGRIPAGAFSVRAVTTNYVDAVNGNDATADGTTEATAYKTLAAALAAAQPGDTVVALPGTYAEGSTVPTKTQSGTAVQRAYGQRRQQLCGFGRHARRRRERGQRQLARERTELFRGKLHHHQLRCGAWRRWALRHLPQVPFSQQQRA